MKEKLYTWYVNPYLSESIDVLVIWDHSEKDNYIAEDLDNVLEEILSQLKIENFDGYLIIWQAPDEFWGEIKYKKGESTFTSMGVGDKEGALASVIQNQES